MKYDVDINIYLNVEAENAEDAATKAYDAVTPEFRKQHAYRICVENHYPDVIIEDYEMTNVQRHNVLIAEQ